ncbi:eCIS core domain-containing protein [Streptomyces phaeochromogenes]|uniref:eCIS core domain-containing protein n=1 Tax=Streptomyces phaeochromogenes TaxID=1923 RepID=UPI0033E2CD86
MTTSASQDAQVAEQAAAERRRKRKERAAKNRAPEPKNIVGGAGQPLDAGVRRELEEQLGHDLGSVRLHTDRDAGALTGMLGADAVAVGQDIFFGEGQYQPGTEQGRALLAHELLHTIQHPFASGTLTAGRDLGQVSAPHEAAERAAEDTAQAVARGEQAPEVAPEANTPAWMRYTTVHADRNRLEHLDPATLVDRLANTVIRSLRTDPTDSAQRVRASLAPLSEELQERVLDRLEHRLLSSEHDFVVDLVTEIDEDGRAESEATARQRGLLAPEVEEDTAEDIRAEREKEQEAAQEEQQRTERTGPAPGPEKQQLDGAGDTASAAGSTPENAGGTIPQGGTPGADAGKAEDEKESDPRTGGDASSPRGDGEQATSPAAQSEQKAGRQEAAATAGEKAGAQAAEKQGGKQGEKSGAEKNGQQGQQQDKGKQAGGKDGDRAEAKQAEEKAKKEAGQEEAAGPRAEDEAAAKARESAAAAEAARKDEPGRDEGTPVDAGRAEGFPGRAGTLDGARTQDQEDEEEREESVGQGGDSEVEVGGGEESAWDIKLRPEDFLPEQDLDVSNVPTSDQIDESAANSAPPTPTFPAPPPTRADKVHAERDQEDQEDAEREAAAERDDPGTADSPPVPGAEEEAAEQGRRTGSELDPEEKSEPKPAPGVASKDPKQGDDPKAGPAAAEATTQEAKDRSKETGGDTAEQAAKEEKGTPAAGGPGDKSSGGGEKGSAQGRADTSATASPSDPAQKGAEGEKAASDEGATGAAKAEESPGPQESKGPKDQGGSGTSDGSASGGGTTDSDSSADTGATPPSGSTSSRPSGSDNSGSGTESSGSTSTEPRSSSRTEKPSPRAQEARTEKPKEQARQPESKAESKAESGGGDDSGTRAAPAAARGGGGGGTASKGGSTGGGKGSAAKAKKASKAAPDLSGGSPEEGLSAASNLKPHQAVEAMDSVGGAVDKDVGKEHRQLASKPPAMDRPTGAPKTLHGDPDAEEAAQYNEDKAARAEDATDEKAEVKGEKKPEGKIDAEEMEEPDFFDQIGMMAGYAIGGIGDWLGFDVTAEDLAAQFAGMPTKDEAMKEAQNGTAPGVDMKGQADEKTEEQGGNTDDKSQEAAETGADDAGRRMGEDQVYPDAPKERLEGKVPAEQGGKSRVGGGGAGTGAVPPEAASEVAEHERKPQFKKALSDGRQDMGKGREKKTQDTRTSQDKHKRQVDKEVRSNTEEQTGKREGVLTDVDKQRSDWTKDQDEELKKLGTKKSDREKKIRDDVKKEEEDTDKDVGKQKETSDKDVKDKGDKAEEDAEKKKDEKVDDSKGWLSKTLDWIKEKFIELRDKVVQIIKDAREAIVEALKNFKETVEGWINAAREGIVEMIKKFIEDLIEFVVSLVEAIIEIGRRIRKFITDLIKAALAFVTKLAAVLKQMMKDLLESIAKLLSDILNVLKKMLLDVLKACKEALKAVLDFATKFIAAFGEFMMILVDILSDPGGWLSGAKNSAYDGAKNHLFNEVKSAVKQWFNDKVKEITGLTEAVWNKLMKGGWTLDKIAKEVWDAIVPQLPFIIGEIVITKVLAKLIPGAGWGAAILEAIQAAIGSLGEILKAIGAVITWLKSVRQGGAGVLFAKAIAAGIVVLLEMAYELILSGIGKYVSKVGKRLKGVAANMGKDKRGGTDKGKDGQGGDDKGGDKGKSDGKSDAGTPNKDDKPGGTVTPANTTKGNRQDPASQHAANVPGNPGRPRRGAPNPTDKGKTAGSTKNDKGGDGKGDNKGPDKDAQGTPSTRPTTKPTKPSTKNDKSEGNDKTPSNKSTKPTPPTSKDKNGNPKNENKDDKKDTRPTPSPKPTTPKPNKTDGPDNTKKDSTTDDTGKDQGPDSNKDKTDSDGSGKKDADGSGKKDATDSDTKDGKKDSDGAGRKDADSSNGKRRKDPDVDSRHKGKDEPGRPKSKTAKDEKKKEEKKNKEDSLREKLLKIHRGLKPKLDRGIPESSWPEILDNYRRLYGLSRLWEQGGESFTIWGKGSPQQPGPTTGVHTTQNQVRTTPLGYPDPEPLVPPFADGAELEPKSFTQRFINQKWAHTHGKKPPADPSGPEWKVNNSIGFQYIAQYDLWKKASGKPAQWDLMHLLPREVGGPGKSTNFVPAPNAINRGFYSAFESGAASKFGHKEGEAYDTKDPGDYHVELELYKGPANGYPGNKYPKWFPKKMSAMYRTHERKDGASGNSKSDWKPRPWEASQAITFNPPPHPGSPTAIDMNNVNLSGTGRNKARIQVILGRNKDVVEAVGRLRRFADIHDMEQKLLNPPTGTKVAGIEEIWPEIKDNYNKGLFIL